MKFLTLLILFALIASFVYAQNDTASSHVYQISKLKNGEKSGTQLMNARTTLLSNIEAYITILKPGQSVHLAKLNGNSEELIIVKQGILTVTINGKTALLSAGGLAFALPNDEHSAKNAGKTKVEYYVIKYKGDSMNMERAKNAGGSVMMNWNEPNVEKTDRGERRQFFDRPTALFSKFDMHATTLNKGAVSHLPHTHRQEEIIILRSGNISMQIGDKHYPATAGALIFLSSGVLHALENTGNGPCTYFAFQWQ